MDILKHLIYHQYSETGPMCHLYTTNTIKITPSQITVLFKQLHISKFRKMYI